MTGPTNVELVRAGFDAFNRAGPASLSALVDLADPDIECYGGPGIEPSGWYSGREEALRWWQEWFEAWEDFRMEPTEFVEVGDSIVVVPLHQTARGKGSGVEVGVDVAYLFEIRDGRVTRFHIYADTKAALEAAGRIESGAAKSAQ